jgi:hypothetical protein
MDTIDRLSAEGRRGDVVRGLLLQLDDVVPQSHRGRLM